MIGAMGSGAGINAIETAGNLLGCALDMAGKVLLAPLAVAGWALLQAPQGDLVNQVTELIVSLSENWQGLVVVMLVLASVAGGPPLYVLNKIINLQEREGRANREMQEKEGIANRAIQREVTLATTNALEKLSEAVRHIEMAMARITK